jgi:hypothetical protein
MPHVPDPDAGVRIAAVAASEALASLVAAMERAGMPDTEARAMEQLRRGVFQLSRNPRGFPSWRSEVHRAT